MITMTKAPIIILYKSTARIENIKQLIIYIKIEHGNNKFNLRNYNW